MPYTPAKTGNILLVVQPHVSGVHPDLPVRIATEPLLLTVRWVFSAWVVNLPVPNVWRVMPVTHRPLMCLPLAKQAVTRQQVLPPVMFVQLAIHASLQLRLQYRVKVGHILLEG